MTVNNKKQTYFKFFRQLCIKRQYNYISRTSKNSLYVEVNMGKKTHLFRFSDHPISAFHQWEPDFDIQDRKSFNDAKKFIKSQQNLLDTHRESV
jgi:hypothetical protein